MISAQSRRGRRIVGSLERGTDLFEALRSICKEHNIRCGELRGTGSLEIAELCSYDQSQQKWKPRRVLSSGGLEMLSLAGNISEEDGATSIVTRVTLMRERDVGVEIVGGRLLAARVFTIEFVIETFDDLILRRRPDVATGLDTWQEVFTAEARLVEAEPAPASATAAAPPRPAPTPSAPPVLRPPLADEREPTLDQFEPVRAAVFEDAHEPEPEIPEEVQLAAGDVIVHPRFRRCVVERIEGNNEFVQVRLRNGRVVRLSLEIIELTPQGIENGQRVFAASIG